MRSNQKNMVVRIITTPLRAMRKAKEFYIRSITGCANNPNYGMAVGGFGHAISRSNSASSFGSSSAAAEDLRELIRANSIVRAGNLEISRAELELYIKQHVAKGSRRVPRSASVGMGRIDEEGPVSNFADVADSDRKVKSDHMMMFPRSKSHAVTSSDKFNRFS